MKFILTIPSISLFLLGVASGNFLTEQVAVGEPLVIFSVADVSAAPRNFTGKLETRQSNYCVSEHNRVRQQNGLSTFTADKRLEAAAASHNDVMVRQNCFSHQCSGEPDFGERIRRQGYQFSSAAENIAAGQSDCAAAVKGWMNSDGHRRNILGNYRHIGCHMQTCSNCQYRTYFTCNFANPR